MNFLNLRHYWFSNNLWRKEFLLQRLISLNSYYESGYYVSFPYTSALERYNPAANEKLLWIPDKNGIADINAFNFSIYLFSLKSLFSLLDWMLFIRPLQQKERGLPKQEQKAHRLIKYRRK